MSGNVYIYEDSLKGEIKNNYEIIDKLEDNSLGFLFK